MVYLQQAVVWYPTERFRNVPRSVEIDVGRWVFMHRHCVSGLGNKNCDPNSLVLAFIAEVTNPL